MSCSQALCWPPFKWHKVVKTALFPPYSPPPSTTVSPLPSPFPAPSPPPWACSEGQMSLPERQLLSDGRADPKVHQICPVWGETCSLKVRLCALGLVPASVCLVRLGASQFRPEWKAGQSLSKRVCSWVSPSGGRRGQRGSCVEEETAFAPLLPTLSHLSAFSPFSSSAREPPWSWEVGSCPDERKSGPPDGDQHGAWSAVQSRHSANQP